MRMKKLQEEEGENRRAEEERLREEEEGPVVRKVGAVRKKAEEGDGVVKRPVLGKSKFRRR